QGTYDPDILPIMGFGREVFYPKSYFEFYDKVNFMKIGICFADKITTVSPRYAQEIQSSSEWGLGLEGVLRERRYDLSGILNGIDYAVWNPETDSHIPSHYSAADTRGKHANKQALLREARL